VAATGTAPVQATFASGFSDGVHGAQFGVEITPATVAVERHGEAAFVPGVPVCLDCGITPGFTAGPWTVFVWTMVSYCSWTQRLAADVCAGEELCQVSRVVAWPGVTRRALPEMDPRRRALSQVPTGRVGKPGRSVRRRQSETHWGISATRVP